MNTKIHNSESGNIFIYILLAITLFAALSYAVSQGGRGNTSTMSDQQAILTAQEIIEYGNTVANAVQKLKLRGCTDTEISFANDVIANYSNSNSPADNSCHVFENDGANINFNSAWSFNKQYHVEDIGATCSNASCADLAALIQTTESSCIEINNKLSIDNPSSAPPIDSDHDFDFFDGNFLNGNVVGDEASSAPISGRNAGCYFMSNTGNYYYYQILIAR